ncbi:MAG: 50S ribosomal protein L24 [Hyphomonadaceae bacterium]
MAARIRKDDVVVVIAGKDKGRTGKVIKVFVKEERVLVEGVNMAKRHTAPSVAHPQGGIIAKEAPIHVSNVALRDPKTGKATRIAWKEVGEGASRRKVRVAKGSGVQIDV